MNRPNTATLQQESSLSFSTQLDSPPKSDSSCSPVRRESSRREQTTNRYQVVDAIRGVAAMIIVAHHITLYAPYSDLADQAAASLTLTLFSYGAYVVQVFLVIGGFALAMALPVDRIDFRGALSQMFCRYMRLAVPYMVTLSVLLVLWFLFGSSMTKPMIDSLSLPQFVAHLFFLQDVLGYGNLSAGTWYLCIDVQFIAICILLQLVLSTMALKLRWTTPVPRLMANCLIPLGLASAWFWNRNADHEVYVFYFMGSLVLGTLVGLTLRKLISVWYLIGYSILLLGSLSIDLRPRLIVAAVTAIVVYLAVTYLAKAKIPALFLWLGKISYSLFLIHYGVSSVVMHWLEPWVGSSPNRACGSMLFALLVSVASAWLLHLSVEKPCQKWIKKLRSKSSSSDTQVALTA